MVLKTERTVKGPTINHWSFENIFKNRSEPFDSESFQKNLKISKKGHMSHCGLAIYIKKYLKAKEELWKLK
jgi:hypothetical protein